MADGCREGDCGQEILSQLIISRGDAPEVLEPSEHALDGIAVAVKIGREAVSSAGFLGLTPLFSISMAQEAAARHTRLPFPYATIGAILCREQHWLAR